MGTPDREVIRVLAAAVLRCDNIIDNAEAMLLHAYIDASDGALDLISAGIRQPEPDGGPSIADQLADRTCYTQDPDAFLASAGIIPEPVHPDRPPYTAEVHAYLTWLMPGGFTPAPDPEHLASEEPTIGDMTVSLDRLDNDENALVVQIDGNDTVILRRGAHPRQVIATIYSPTTGSPSSAPHAVTIPPWSAPGGDEEPIEATIMPACVTPTAEHAWAGVGLGRSCGRCGCPDPDAKR